MNEPNRIPTHFNNTEALGIIAGSRSLPLEIATSARNSGVGTIVAVGIEGETDPSMVGLVDSMTWVKVGQLGRLIEAFKSAGVRRCVMAGQVAPRNLFDLRPDLRAMKLLLKIKEKNAHSLFGAIAEELGSEGIELVEAIPWLGKLLAGPGFHIGPQLKPSQTEDVEFGFRIVKEIARLEIGQLVVVKNGTVLAVEGFEGTDKCLTRGGELAGPKGGAVAVKVAKVGHDMRFDIPCIGISTARTASAAGVDALAVEPGKTIVLDQPELREFCKKQGFVITVVQ